MNWIERNFESMKKLNEYLIQEHEKINEALDKSCKKLTELDECLLIYKHYPDYIKRTMNKEEWKEWCFKDE